MRSAICVDIRGCCWWVVLALLAGDCGDSKDAVQLGRCKDSDKARRIMNGSSGSVRIVGPLAFTLSLVRCARRRIAWDFVKKSESSSNVTRASFRLTFFSLRKAEKYTFVFDASSLRWQNHRLRPRPATPVHHHHHLKLLKRGSSIMTAMLICCLLAVSRSI